MVDFRDAKSWLEGGTNAEFLDGDPSVSPIADIISMYYGFDREDAWAGGKSNGVIQYCQTAASGEVHQCDYNKDGDYTLDTTTGTFLDGTPLADRTFAIMPAPGEDSFFYWFAGQKILVEGIKTKVIPFATGAYIVFDSTGELVIENDARTAIVFRTLAGLIYDNGGNNIWFGDERHGKLKTGQDHLQDHQTIGFTFARAGGGAEIYGLANNSTAFTKISASKFVDEDIRMVIAEATAIPFLYMDSGGGWVWTAASNELSYIPVADPQWNDVAGGGGLLDVTGNDCLIQLVAVCNNKVHPIMNVIGQAKFLNRSDARDALFSYKFSTETGNLPGPEARVIAGYIITSSDNALLPGDDGEIWIDYRESAVGVPRQDILV